MNTAVPALLAVLLFGVLIFLMILRGGRGRSGFNRKTYQTAWLKIENGLTRSNPASFQVAVLEADKLLDKALKETGATGATFGERLKAAGSRFNKPDLDKVWAAHKLRNRLAHETDAKITYPQAKVALAGFKRGLKVLGAI